MSAKTDLDNVRHAVTELQSAVRLLRASWGDSLGVRRVTSDVDRLLDDLNEIGEPLTASEREAAASPTLEVIPDVDYDRSFWMDAEDEGLGAVDRRTQ
jgi:hypothetical protein